MFSEDVRSCGFVLADSSVQNNSSVTKNLRKFVKRACVRSPAALIRKITFIVRSAVKR